MAEKRYIDVKDSELVEYFLYPELPALNNATEINLQFVDSTSERIHHIARKLTEEYVWHCDEFQVVPYNVVSFLHSNSYGTDAFSFYGSLHYGENIEDEWFLVYMLLELTRQIKGLVVRVRDGDGEFLLIEAADQLPTWATPETCEDRVFLYDGNLHILPKTFKCNGVSDEVLRRIRQPSGGTAADTTVQAAIQKKIRGYPEKIQAGFHHTNLYVPVGVASLLKAEPKLIAPAVRAFCERDLLDMKACRAMRFFPPENRVMTQVKMTRCVYAMLASSKYIPDRRTGWNLPSPNEETYKSHMLGIKTACGFEILMSQARIGDTKSPEDTCTTDFDNDQNWKKFVNSLTSKNYFRGLMEYSKEHTQLMDNAKEFYRNSCKAYAKPHRGRQVADILDRIEVDVEELKMKEKDLPPADDDSWMNITQRDLDAMLEARFGPLDQNGVTMANGNADISQHLKTFINHVSGVGGAEFPTKDSKSSAPSRPKRGVKNKKRKSVKFSPDTKLHSVTSSDNISAQKTNAHKIQFEPDGFINAIQNILDFSIPDDNYWESEGSGMSSYEDEADMDLSEGIRLSGSDRENDMIRYMDEMDRELSSTTLSKSFLQKKTQENSTGNDNKAGDSFDDIEAFQPVDIDLNALKNILSSYQAQMGESGPAENILGPLGVNLDDIDADVD